MTVYGVLNTNTGDLECTKCGDKFNLNKHLPLPVEMACAMMRAWGKMHLHDLCRKCRGTRVRDRQPCPHCKGTGKRNKGEASE